MIKILLAVGVALFAAGCVSGPVGVDDDSPAWHGNSSWLVAEDGMALSMHLLAAEPCSIDLHHYAKSMTGPYLWLETVHGGIGVASILRDDEDFEIRTGDVGAAQSDVDQGPRLESHSRFDPDVSAGMWANITLIARGTIDYPAHGSLRVECASPPTVFNWSFANHAVLVTPGSFSGGTAAKACIGQPSCLVGVDHIQDASLSLPSGFERMLVIRSWISDASAQLRIHGEAINTTYVFPHPGFRDTLPIPDGPVEMSLDLTRGDGNPPFVGAVMAPCSSQPFATAC